MTAVVVAFLTTSKKEINVIFLLLVLGAFRCYFVVEFLTGIELHVFLDRFFPQYSVYERFNLSFGLLVFISTVYRNACALFRTDKMETVTKMVARIKKK